MSHISLYNDNEDQKLKSLAGTESGFVVPDGYFEELPISIKIQLGEISELDITSIEKHEYPFSNPTDYFEQLKSLPNKIRDQSRIQHEESFEPTPLIPTNETGFDLPDGYFGQARYHIIDETSHHKNIADKGKENTFNVDENYFEKSKKHILAQTTEQNKTTGYRSIIRKPNLKTLMRYAAVITIAFGLGYFSHTKQNIVVYNNNGQLSKPVIIEDITYEELQAALFDEDLDNDDLIEIATMQTPVANNSTNKKTIINNTNSPNNKKQKNYTPSPDKTPTQQQIEQYILDNNDDLNSDEL